MSSNSGTGIHRLLPQNFFGSVNEFLTNTHITIMVDSNLSNNLN